MSGLFKPTIDDLIVSAERELKYRLSVFPRMVTKGTMKPEKMSWEIECSREIIKLLIAMKKDPR